MANDPAPATAFTYRSARSGAIVAGFAIVLAVETVALHTWLAPRHPLLAWSLTIASLATIAWLVRDYQALGRGAIHLTGHDLELAIGRRAASVVPVETIATAVRPEWRDIPASGTPEAAGYVNLLKPASPNVLLTLSSPATVRLPGGMKRQATRLGLCMDAPDEFVSAVRAVMATPRGRIDRPA